MPYFSWHPFSNYHHRDHWLLRFPISFPKLDLDILWRTATIGIFYRTFDQQITVINSSTVHSVIHPLLMPADWCRYHWCRSHSCRSLLMPKKLFWCQSLLMPVTIDAHEALLMPVTIDAHHYWCQSLLMPVTVDAISHYWCPSLLMPVTIDARHYWCPSFRLE